MEEKVKSRAQIKTVEITHCDFFSNSSSPPEALSYSKIQYSHISHNFTHTPLNCQHTTSHTVYELSDTWPSLGSWER